MAKLKVSAARSPTRQGRAHGPRAARGSCAGAKKAVLAPTAPKRSFLPEPLEYPCTFAHVAPPQLFSPLVVCEPPALPLCSPASHLCSHDGRRRRPARGVGARAVVVGRGDAAVHHEPDAAAPARLGVRQAEA
eukprot:3827602-Prymnesium_polylepis.1